MPPRELRYLLGDVRTATARYLRGGDDSFDGFFDLASLLLNVTVMSEMGGVRLVAGESGVKYLAGWRGIQDPLPLTDGRYLRLIMALYLEKTDKGRLLKVDEASAQYQADREGKRWIFRYDYRRHPKDRYAAGHVQINGTLTETGASMSRIHFPTGRVSLEAILRLLIEDFGVPPREPAENWRAVLAESETEFLRIAHQAPSGPAA